MLSGIETVWIGNYINQEEGLLYEVQILTETKEEAHEKYVKYYRDEVMTWEGGENYALCSIDSLIEGRNTEELERDKELNWFFPDGFFADGDHCIDDLNNEEQAELIAKIIQLPAKEKEVSKPGDRIYFGKYVNADVDTIWIGGVIALDKDRAIAKLRANVDDEMELIEISVGNSFELFENISEEEQNYYKDTDFFLYKPVKLKRE